MSTTYAKINNTWLDEWVLNELATTTTTTGTTFNMTGEWEWPAKRDRWSQMLRDKAIDAEGHKYKERVAKSRSGWLPLRRLKNL